MKILAFEHELPGTTASQFQRLTKPEARKVWDLHQAGLIREMYFRADRDEAMLVLECASVKAALESLAQLPFVEAGLIEFEPIALKAYPGLSRLFKND